LNDGGWLTERQWEYWDKRIRQEKLKLNEAIQFWHTERKRHFGQSSVDAMLKKI
jgi:hypothetical protein